jgi:ribosomal protein S18 acetylase RimI-like enzyme
MPGTGEIIIEKLSAADRDPLENILHGGGVFNHQEVDCALELIDDCLTDKDSDYNIYTAKKNGQVLGYICYGKTPLTNGVYDLYWLVVGSVFQGQGIGKQLLEFMESQVKDKARLIIIETSSRKPYERARRLYVSMDYKILAQVPDYYDLYDNKLIFGKNL